MNVRPVITNFYRYNFRDLLANKPAEDTGRSIDEKKPLIADIYVSRRSVVPSSPAPQGVGEMKHAATEGGKAPIPEDQTDDLKQVTGKDADWTLESAVKYDVDTTYYKPPLAVRQEMESKVRKCKKANLPCHHADRNFNCSALYIRCGDRIQYAVPESTEQKNMPHVCLYRPEKNGNYILIIDSNKAIREFCKTSIEVFFKYDSDKIVTAESGHKAIDILNDFKIEGKQVGLIICDTNLTGISGYDVVTELFDRNYNTEVIMTKEQNQQFSEPPDFKGLQEIVPDKAIVKKIISKPFHSQAFINSLKELDISPLLESKV
jgi:CheY-like chemotaxis protein